MLLNWYGILTISILIIFLIEILTAIRIYRKRRTRTHSKSTQNQSVLVIVNQIQPGNQPARNNEANTIQPYQITELTLSNPNHPSTRSNWSQFNLFLCLSGVFLLTFLILNFLLRPYNYAWTLILLPILFPLPFMVLPSIFNTKSFTTFSCLLCGLGVGAITFLFVLI